MGNLARSTPSPASAGLAADTPVPTPSGWSLLGDLRRGDTVFAATGHPCTILSTWATPAPVPACQVRTGCGDTLVAALGQPWCVRISQARPPQFVPRPGSQLLQREGTPGLRVPMLPPVPALQLPPHASLPVPPYLLGIWLGDGVLGSAEIATKGPERRWLLPELHRLGQPVLPSRGSSVFALPGILRGLQSLGVLAAKAMPLHYVRAAPAQRLELLQGLVDTTGTVDPQYGRTVLRTTSLPLALGMCELVRTLGARALFSINRPYNQPPRYTIKFFLASAARMPWKAANARGARLDPGAYLHFAPAQPGSMAAIGVDAPGGMFLAGRSMVPAWAIPPAA